MEELYVIIRTDCADLDTYQESHAILGIFLTKEMAIDEVNNYILNEKNRVKNPSIENEKFIIPDKPLTFEDVFCKDYTFYNDCDYFSFDIRIVSYKPDEIINEGAYI